MQWVISPLFARQVSIPIAPAWRIADFNIKTKIMLSIEQCRRIMGNIALTDSELEKLRNSLYIIAGLIIDETVSGYEENRGEN
jgi:hypothetical protein